MQKKTNSNRKKKIKQKTVEKKVERERKRERDKLFKIKFAMSKVSKLAY